VGQAVETRGDGAQDIDALTAFRARFDVGAQRRNAETGVAVDQEVELVGEKVAVLHLSGSDGDYDGGWCLVSRRKMEDVSDGRPRTRW
jgi:hypothetical protein